MNWCCETVAAAIARDAISCAPERLRRVASRRGGRGGGLARSCPPPPAGSVGVRHWEALPSKRDCLPIRIAPDRSRPWAIRTDVTDGAERGDLTVGMSLWPSRDAPELTNRASSTCKICTTSEAANSTSLTPSGWHLSTATLWNHPSGVGSTSGIPVWSKNSICFESDHGCGPDRLSWESIPKRN